MDFVLSPEQEALAGLVRDIVARRYRLEHLRRSEGTPHAVDDEGWAALAEAGVFTLTLPEDEGGAGLGLADAAVVFEELGRGLVPGPLVATHLAATLLGVAGAADGAVVVTAPLPGEPCLVPYLAQAGALVVEGAAGPTPVGGAVLEQVRDAAVPVARSLDPLTPLWRLPDPADVLSGSSVPADAEGTPWTTATRVLTGALCVGLAGAACDLAVAYAKQRQQFGRPIGSFQAVKHLCADMLVRTETSRAAVQAAAVTVDQGGGDEGGAGDPQRAAAGGALLAAEAAVANAKACIQVHGGTGFTWEVPAHLYLMRARLLAASLGPPDRLATLVAARY